ncbi:MAG: ferredoxin [Planctomycetes bacterium]|nr:ferredoxin [Planctomycetota bacterium]
MADPQNRVSRNVAGEWFVDVDCIDCDLCRTTAPENFAANEDDGYSYVSKQPTSESEVEACRQAMAECPVEAIGHAPQ